MLIRRWLSLALALGVASPVLSAPSAPAAAPGGAFMVRPRAADAVYAGEDVDIEFFIGDTRKSDPVLGPAPVPRATVKARVTMPAMPGMGDMVPSIHEEGQPGYYGMVLNFPHGGEYQAVIALTTRGGEAGTLSLPLNVLDPKPGQKREKPYRLEFSTSPSRPRAGEPTTLALRYLSRKERRVATAFDLVHEQKMHLIVVSRDLRFFDHVHPDLSADGTFRVGYTFPFGGDFLVFADATPTGAGQQVLSASLRVAGPPPPEGTLTRSAGTQPDPSQPMRGNFGDLTVSVQPERTPLRAREDNKLVFTLTRNGQPVTALAPWLGALGHLVLINVDGETFVHSHPVEQADSAGNAVPQNGTVAFWVRFPKSGVYRLWGQFNVGQGTEKIVTADFAVSVGAAS
jgi:hypothetical protein